VPVYPPAPASYKKDIARAALIARTAGASLALTSTEYLQAVTAMKWKGMLTMQGSVETGFVWKAVPDALFRQSKRRVSTFGAQLHVHDAKPSDVAFLQFTSGSTGDPKGVMVTNGALMHNIEVILRNSKLERGGTLASWMPQYHDFGLIVMMLLPMVKGLHAVVMSPLTFLKNPIIWLTTITKFRAQATCSPSFGYARCVLAWNRLSLEKRPHIDLSSLLFCGNAAEPIRSSVLREWQETFEPHGLDPATMIPCYGLAEHVVYAGGCWPIVPGTNSRVLLDPETGMVACMKMDLDKDIEVLIVEASTPGDHDEKGRTPKPVPEGDTGEIWLRSPSVAAGYWGRPDLTEQYFGAQCGGKRWLRTGDLAYVKEGYLYITGRLKDVIIVHGRNIYPQDVEQSLEACNRNIRPGCTAAFQMATGLGGGADEMLPTMIGVVAEVRSPKISRHEAEKVIQDVRQAVADHGLEAQVVALVKPRTIPKTVSIFHCGINF